MKRKFWNWSNEEGERTLFLNGEISDETWFGDEVTPKMFKDELYAASGNVTVWLNSPGGDVFAATQIYNMLKDYPSNVVVKIDAIAASAASVIAMAGNKTYMSPVAMMMIHNPATMAIGQKSDMEKAIEMLDEVKEAIINAYELKSGMSRNKISRLMDSETWFNAKKALEMGFIDEILFDADKKEEEDEEEKDNKNPFVPKEDGEEEDKKDKDKEEDEDDDNEDESDKTEEEEDKNDESDEEDENEEEKKKKELNLEAFMYSKKDTEASFINKVTANKKSVSVDMLKARLELLKM